MLSRTISGGAPSRSIWLECMLRKLRKFPLSRGTSGLSSGGLRHPPKTQRFRPPQIIAKRQQIELVFDPPERNVFGTGASRRPRFRRDATSNHTASAHDKRESESFLVNSLNRDHK